jgi:hypothetical protein
MIEFIHIPKTAGNSIKSAMGLPVSKHKGVSGYSAPKMFFTSTRNPYDRAVSIFYFLTRNKNYKKTINDFWVEIVSTGLFFHLLTFKKQMDFLRDDITKGGISPRIKTVLRYETLADDWAAFAAKHNLPPLEHKNRSHQRPAIPWQDELSDESIARIGELYADDFEHLNYERIG